MIVLLLKIIHFISSKEWRHMLTKSSQKTQVKPRVASWRKTMELLSYRLKCTRSHSRGNCTFPRLLDTLYIVMGYLFKIISGLRIWWFRVLDCSEYFKPYVETQYSQKKQRQEHLQWTTLRISKHKLQIASDRSHPLDCCYYKANWGGVKESPYLEFE